jgi:hypothetical protein
MLLYSSVVERSQFIGTSTSQSSYPPSVDQAGTVEHNELGGRNFLGVAASGLLKRVFTRDRDNCRTVTVEVFHLWRRSLPHRSVGVDPGKRRAGSLAEFESEACGDSPFVTNEEGQREGQIEV